MPKSDHQLRHLEILNSLERTKAGRFKKGDKAWNASYPGYPRNKHRQPLEPCPDCGQLKIVYHKRCKRCCDIAKRKTHPRLGVGGYIYGAQRIPKPDGKTRAKPIHIEIAERVLGRPMKRGEHVHHINCRRDDNRNSNLLICSAKYHTWLHGQYAKRFAQLHLKN